MQALRVLVVDDEPGMRLGMDRALRDWKITIPEADEPIPLEISQAASGDEALRCVRNSPTDILLLDHKLPGVSGLDVLAEVTRSTDIVTIMITAYASLETAVVATKRGAFDFLAKPFTPAELRSAIQKAARHLILIRRARELAEERHRVRFQFLSILAHELKAPLAAIEGYLHIVHDRSAGEDPAVYSHIVERCLFRAGGMRKLIMDLLDLTRIESGTKKRELVDVNLAALARTAVETVMPDATRRGVSVTVQCDEQLSIHADRGEIEIILNNLLSNAVKYNRQDGRAELIVTSDGAMMTIAVSDTGIGLTEEERGRLFHDFTRIRNDKNRDVLGSGLGLSIVKKLTSLYGGDVSIESTPDVGSTFRVKLPLSPPASEHEHTNHN